jgi:hypothetical protein
MSGWRKRTIMEMAQEAGFELDCTSLEWHKRIDAFAKLVREDERHRITELVDQYDGWIAKEIRADAGEPEEPLPDVYRAALLRELLPEIQKMFNVAYKERNT